MAYIDVIGWIAALFTMAAFSMKTMIPLRVMAILSNVCFITYGALDGIYPVVVLHCILLPFNTVRLVQMKKLIGQARDAATKEFEVGWIRPYMSEKTFRAGETIFARGDDPDLFFYLVSGRVRFPEIGKEAGPGEIFGEIAFFAPEHGRASTAVCTQAATVYCLDESALKQLYFQNPSFGYYLMRLVAGRLSERATRPEAAGAG